MADESGLFFHKKWSEGMDAWMVGKEKPLSSKCYKTFACSLEDSLHHVDKEAIVSSHFDQEGYLDKTYLLS